MIVTFFAHVLPIIHAVVIEVIPLMETFVGEILHLEESVKAMLIRFEVYFHKILAPTQVFTDLSLCLEPRASAKLHLLLFWLVVLRPVNFYDVAII